MLGRREKNGGHSTKSGNRQDLETLLGSSKVFLELELGLGLGLGLGFLSSGERSMPSQVQKTAVSLYSG